MSKANRWRAIYSATGPQAARNKRLLITAVRFNAGLRWRIELSCPAVLLNTAAKLIGSHPESTPEQKEWAAPVLARFKEAAGLPFADLKDKDHNRAADLAEDACNYAFGAAAEHVERSCMWIGLTTLFWLERMLEVDPDLLIENSPLHHATYELLERLKLDPGLMGDMEASARKASMRLGRAWNEIELYRDGEGLFARRASHPVKEAA